LGVVGHQKYLQHGMGRPSVTENAFGASTPALKVFSGNQQPWADDLVHNGQGLCHSIVLYECHSDWFTMGWTSPRPLCWVRCCASPFGWAWWCTQHNGQSWDHSMTLRSGVPDSTI
jgi:hypothetical protein